MLRVVNITFITEGGARSSLSLKNGKLIEIFLKDRRKIKGTVVNYEIESGELQYIVVQISSLSRFLVYGKNIRSIREVF